MITKYYCEKCGWTGDYPIIVNKECGSEGYRACPNGCCDEGGEPTAVMLNPGHPENIRMFIKAFFNIYPEEN